MIYVINISFLCFKIETGMHVGAETFTIQRKQESMINATKIRYLMRIAGLTKQDRCRSEYLRENFELVFWKIELNWYNEIGRQNVKEDKRNGNEKQ